MFPMTNIISPKHQNNPFGFWKNQLEYRAQLFVLFTLISFTFYPHFLYTTNWLYLLYFQIVADVKDRTEGRYIPDSWVSSKFLSSSFERVKGGAKKGYIKSFEKDFGKFGRKKVSLPIQLIVFSHHLYFQNTRGCPGFYFPRRFIQVTLDTAIIGDRYWMLDYFFKKSNFGLKYDVCLNLSKYFCKGVAHTGAFLPCFLEVKPISQRKVTVTSQNSFVKIVITCRCIIGIVNFNLIKTIYTL